MRNFLPTLLEVVLGFIFGNLIAILLAIWFVHSKVAEKAFYPIAVFVKAIPTALAPILVLIFGTITPKIIIAGLICFSDAGQHGVQGLRLRAARHAGPDAGSLCKPIGNPLEGAHSSSPSFPFAALPKIAATSSVMGAIVAEWIGSSFGLGAPIIEATHNFCPPLLYATVVIAALLAVVLFFTFRSSKPTRSRWKPAGQH